MSCKLKPEGKNKSCRMAKAWGREGKTEKNISIFAGLGRLKMNLKRRATDFPFHALKAEMSFFPKGGSPVMTWILLMTFGKRALGAYFCTGSHKPCGQSWDRGWLHNDEKVRLVKAMVFPVVMYRCESWTIKKAECRRIDAFELWCWRRLLRVP